MHLEKSFILKVERFCVDAGVSFETSSAALIDQIPSALAVFAEAVDDFLKVPTNQVHLQHLLIGSCHIAHVRIAKFSFLKFLVCLAGGATVSQIIVHGWVQLLPGDKMVARGQILQVLSKQTF